MSAEQHVHMDVQGTTFTYIQQTLIHHEGEEEREVVKALHYDYKRCASCGICVDVCPNQALAFGPIQEIATGMDAPPVELDPDECSFCGLCEALCPVNAIKMEGHEPRPGLIKSTRFTEDCKPCTLCRDACPEEAIEVEFSFTEKEELFAFDETREGEIEVDLEECTLCGACVEFCDAFLLMNREASPIDPTPYEALFVDEDECDYCGLCIPLCPEEAIAVEGEEIDVEAPVLGGEVGLDEDKCTHCGYCVEVCPYDAVEVEKPMEGEIKLLQRNLGLCDPSGCHACFNVCPGHCWYTPDSQPIDSREDFCVYCGACELVCPKEIIRVRRGEVHHEEVPMAPWAREWHDALDSLVTGIRNRPDLGRVLRPLPEETPPAPEFELPEVDEEAMRRVGERLSGLLDALGDVKTRYVWEQKDKAGAAGKIVSRLEGKEEKG